ncbi:MAG: hypothetical protein IJ335_04280, partial [Lachnospiraceae bacterium]|nr:hypothetical protein [Lachnospiraceae bacterium]
MHVKKLALRLGASILAVSLVLTGCGSETGKVARDQNVSVEASQDEAVSIAGEENDKTTVAVSEETSIPEKE